MRNKEMVEYKSNIFTRIKTKIISLFGKKETVIKKDSPNSVTEVSNMEKARIMNLYDTIKQDSSKIDNVSEQDLYKLMLLLNEEITIINEKVEIKSKELEEKVAKINKKTA